MEEGISNHQDNGVAMATDEKSPKGRKIDIAQFVMEVEKFNRLIEPFSFLLYVWDDVRRWRYPLLTVVMLIVCNIGCVILTQGAVFTLVSLLVITIATICLVQLHTRLLDRVMPETVRRDSWSEEMDEHNTLQTVRDFKYSLIQMHDFVVKCNEYLTYFYSLLKWDFTSPALRFHTEICLFLLCLVVMPTRWIFLIVTNWFFLATEDVYRAVFRYSVALLECAQGKRTFSSVFEAISQNSTSAKDGNAGSDVEEEEEEDGICDIENTNTTSTYSLSEDGISLEGGDLDPKLQQNKPGMVARLMELKKRRQHIANESCFDCKVSFSSILKRRLYCRHCGNNFCSKCCNQKVPKSLFGATAPSAQTETVLVCNTCFKLLKSEKETDAKEKAG